MEKHQTEFIECASCGRKIHLELAKKHWWPLGAYNFKNWGCFPKPHDAPYQVDGVLISSDLEGCGAQSMIKEKENIAQLKKEVELMKKTQEVADLKKLLLQAIGTIEYLPPSYGAKWKQTEEEEFPQYKPEKKDVSTQTDFVYML